MGIFTKQAKTLNRVVLLPAEEIVSNPAQPRRIFELNDLECLAESIRQNGILQPLTVRINFDNQYELISGERRLKAAKLAKLKMVPCIILDTNSKQSAVFALIENIQRRDLNYFEEALAIRNLIVEWGITQEEASKRLGKAQSTIANKLRLLKFTEQQQKKILQYELTERHARALLKLPDSQAVDKVIHCIASKQLNVKQTEEYVETFLKQEVKATPKFIPVIKDVRVFFNTMDKAVKLMQKSGILASAEKVTSPDYIQYIVKIPVQNQ